MKVLLKKQIPYMFLFPLLLCYFEMVFHISTAGGIRKLSLISALLFSLAYGLVIYFPVSFVPGPKANKRVTALLILLLGVLYGVEYFVYRQFKIFYDVSTVLRGAGDVMKSFMGTVFQLVFSYDGILMIALFLLPYILYLVFSRRITPEKKSGRLQRFVAAMAAVVLCAASLLAISSVPLLKSMYKTDYNFQTVVDNFGLLTGIRMDVTRLIRGGSSGSFEQGGKIAAGEPCEPEPIEYGYNKIDLRFNETGSEKISNLNDYVRSLTPSRRNEYTGLFKGKNLILITAEAFCAQVIDPELTPTLYRLANRGIRFTDFYQPAGAGTTGGEYQNIFGMLPTDGGGSFKDTASHLNYYTMGWQLNRLGYFGMAFHNNTYTYYDRDKTHTKLGYSGGYMGYGNGMEQFVTNQWPQSDLEMMEGTLPLYIGRQPFNVYYMTVSGHCGYSRTGNSMTAKNWAEVEGLPYSDPVKGYLAANLELEYAMAHLLDELEKNGIADDTVICLTGDHFPYGLDSDAGFGDMPYLEELYGYSVNNYFQRDRSALVLWCGALETMPPVVVDAPSFSLDILPTLFNLFGVEYDSRLLPGRDVLSDADPLVFNMNYDWKTEKGTYLSSRGIFYPADDVKNVSEGYISRMKTVVRNKIRYCEQVLDNDYFRYLFE